MDFNMFERFKAPSILIYTSQSTLKELKDFHKKYSKYGFELI